MAGPRHNSKSQLPDSQLWPSSRHHTPVYYLVACKVLLGAAESNAGAAALAVVLCLVAPSSLPPLIQYVPVRTCTLLPSTHKRYQVVELRKIMQQWTAGRVQWQPAEL